MNQQEILGMFAKIGAIITDSHVVYTSGKHGSAYVNKDAIYPRTWETSRLCNAIASRFSRDAPEVVIAPAVGGVILSQWVAFHLSKMLNREVLGVYAEKTENGESFVIKRGYDKLVQGRRVLVVEDVVTTGGSVKKVVVATRAIGGKVIGVGVLCNRGAILAESIGVSKLLSLVDVKLEAWDEDECPLCREWTCPINLDVGKGREFLARKGVSV